MTFLELKTPTAEQLPAVVEIDQLCFGGHWTLEGYQRELASPNSHFLILSIPSISANVGLPNFNGKLEDLSKEPKLLNQPQNPQSDAVPTLAGLGCFWSILEEAHITLLAIHPVYQRQGLGQLLFFALVHLARRQGLERATLELRASNQAALSLYQKFGFQEAGRRRRYYQDTGEDALILWRGGLQSPEFSKNLVDWDQQVSDRLCLGGWDLLEVGVNLSI